jgi:hypothetical protein
MKSRVSYEDFSNIKTKEISYILGFLWADGYIRKPYTISSTINMKDSADMKRIFSKTGDWNFYNCNKLDKRTNRNYTNFTITTSNRCIVDFLIENDYDKKSIVSPTKILSRIPDEYKLYFFRGISDGDGCFYKNKTLYQYIITGAYEQDWFSVEELFKQLKINYNIRLSKTKNSKYSQIKITNKNDIDIFGEYIYKNFDNLGLNRKYSKYLEIKKISIKKLSHWTENELDFLKNNYYNLSNTEIGLILNKTKYSIDAKSSKLKLKNQNEK